MLIVVDMVLNTEQVETTRQGAKYIGVRSGDWSSVSQKKHQHGFTMVELITVMVIVGVLAAVAVPRFFDRGTFDSRGFHDQVISTLRYAQKAAIAERRLVCVSFPSSTRIVINTATNFADSACNTDLQSPSGTYPAGQTTYTVDVPSGVTLSGYMDFNFNALGKPSTGVAQSITVSGYATPIAVEMETGYVH
jgi:MSHA pilin protein MshC